MKVFQININRFGLLVLPTFLRRSVVAAFVGSFLTPVRLIRSDFLDARAESTYRIEHNGQVCYLRKMLNDAFSYDRQNGFRIEDVYTAEVYPEWLMAYDETVQLRNQIKIARDEPPHATLYDRDFIQQVEFNFYVFYPADLSEDELRRVKMLVNTYKLVSRTAAYKQKV